MKSYQTTREPQRCFECGTNMTTDVKRFRHPVCADCRRGYRVDMLMLSTGTYAEYTALNAPVTLAMAEALGRGLKRQGQPGRIVSVPGDEVVEVWP